MGAMRIGAATVDSAARSITKDGVTRRASPKAIAVLTVLADADGEVVSRTALLERVWSDVCVGEEVLTQAIAELRRAFGDSPRNAQYIQTVPKAGYRLLPTQRAPDAQYDNLLPTGDINTDAAIESMSSYYAGCAAFELGGRDNIDKAIHAYREAIEIDPTFAAAHAWLSVALCYKQLYYGPALSFDEDPISAAQKAIKFDRSAPEGYAAYGFALAQQGDIDHAITSFKAAMRIRGDAFFPMVFFGRVLFAHRAYGAAAMIFDRASELRGGDFHSVMLGAAATRAAGDNLQAAAKLKRAEYRCDQKLGEEPDDLRGLVCKTYCQIEEGGVAFAQPLLERLKENYDPLTYYLVGALARQGALDMAMDRFEAIVDNGWSDPSFLKSDHDLDPLRNEPRFQKIANALAA